MIYKLHIACGRINTTCVTSRFDPVVTLQHTIFLQTEASFTRFRKNIYVLSHTLKLVPHQAEPP